MMGESYNGPYAVAYKIPALIILVAGVFMNAWQISAVTEQKQRERFYSRVANAYASVLIIVASLVLLFDRWVIGLWVSDTYFIAWKYVPLLTLATVFTCLVDFLGSVYMVEKKSVHSLATAAVSAGVNLVLNAIMIPLWGVNGAALATLISYLLVFIIRIVDTRKYIRIGWDHWRMWLSFLLLGVQTILLLMQIPQYMLWEAILTVIIVIVNAQGLIRAVKQMLHRGNYQEEE
jgi:O-antigen/teichoic acid export membrane protein